MCVSAPSKAKSWLSQDSYILVFIFKEKNRLILFLFYCNLSFFNNVVSKSISALSLLYLGAERNGLSWARVLLLSLCLCPVLSEHAAWEGRLSFDQLAL